MPEELAVFPLSTVLLPGGILSLYVFEHRYKVLTATCLAGTRTFGVVLIAAGSEVGGGEVRTTAGTRAVIEQVRELDDGALALVVRGTTRFRVLEWLEDDPHPRGLVETVEDDPPDPSPAAIASAAASVRRARARLCEWRTTAPPLGEAPRAEPGALGWWLCEEAPLGPLDRQALLEAPAPDARLGLVAELAGAVAGDLEALLAGA